MLHPATTQLIKHLTSTYSSYTIVSNYIQTIRKLGTREDVSALMLHYYNNPTANHVDYILNLLYDFGTLADAEDLWQNSFEDELLKPNYSEKTLHLLGYLGLQKSAPTLLKYAFHLGDYSFGLNAVLALVHLDCTAYQAEIIEELESCYGKSLFSEFSPALTCKVSNQYDILSHFYKMGSSIVSTDCNAGIVLAFSLCGELGRDFFWKVLWDHHWECLGGGTGTDYWTYIAMRNLDISFLELYQIIQSTKDEPSFKYQLQVFISLVKCALRDNPHPIRWIKLTPISFVELYQTLFAWKDANTSDNIVDLARKVDLRNSIYQLRDLLEGKMREEMLCL